MKKKKEAVMRLLYDPCGCPQLSQEQQAAKVTLWQYNQYDLRDGARRQCLFKSLLCSSNDGLYIEPSFHCDYSYLIHISKNIYVNVNLIILDCAPVTLGDNIFVSSNIWIGDGVIILLGIIIKRNLCLN